MAYSTSVIAAALFCLPCLANAAISLKHKSGRSPINIPCGWSTTFQVAGGGDLNDCLARNGNTPSPGYTIATCNTGKFDLTCDESCEEITGNLGVAYDSPVELFVESGGESSRDPNNEFIVQCSNDTIGIPSVYGEPHFRTWRGENYDFQGVCDLVLLENRNFMDGVGMNIHIRTKKYKQHWSYIASAVLQIGKDTLEVSAGSDGSKGEYWINGASGETTWEDGDILEETISGYPITCKHPTTKTAEFEVDIGHGNTVSMRTWGKFVRVNIMTGAGSSSDSFDGSRGLLGTIAGAKLARDNVTILEDPNEFGQEWQVHANEPKLFHNVEGPQFPQKCIVPSAVEMRRNLRESTISNQEAQLVCSRANDLERDSCVFDVMATDNIGVAGAYI